MRQHLLDVVVRRHGEGHVTDVAHDHLDLCVRGSFVRGRQRTAQDADLAAIVPDFCDGAHVQRAQVGRCITPRS